MFKIAAILFILILTICGADALCATLYENHGYGGKIVQLDDDNRNFQKIDFDDMLSSYKVQSHCELTLFKHIDYQGDRLTVTGNGRVPDDWNDIASSAKCECYCARLYEDIGYRGTQLKIKNKNSNLEKKQFNNVLSSYKVKPTCKLVLYEDNGFNGKKITVSGNGDVPDIFDDKTSSAKCDCCHTCCHGKHFVYTKKLQNECNFLPVDWSKINKYCEDTNANRQSPIILVTGKCLDRRIEDLYFSRKFYELVEFDFVNNGHSISFTPKSVLTVQGGNMVDTTYKVHSFHFHWGSGRKFDTKGSEHRVISSKGEEYPTSLEMHIVTYREDLTFSEALKSSDGLSVIAVLYQSKDSKSDGRKDNDAIELAFRKINTILSSVRDPRFSDNSEHNIELRLKDLIPSDTRMKVINYDGSLTTPTCNPVVQWHVIYPPVSIDSKYIRQFTKLTFDGKVVMKNNFRPTMSLHDRKMRCN